MRIADIKKFHNEESILLNSYVREFLSYAWKKYIGAKVPYVWDSEGPFEFYGVRFPDPVKLPFSNYSLVGFVLFSPEEPLLIFKNHLEFEHIDYKEKVELMEVGPEWNYFVLKSFERARV